VKILWASPLPPTRSGVSDYAVELIAELRRISRVRIVAPPDWERPADWPLGEDTPVVASDTKLEQDEINVAHLGNNPFHTWVLARLDLPRTVVVLHDLVMHHLLVEATLGRGDSGRFVEALARSHREAAGPLARARAVGVTGDRDPFLYPARESLLSGAAGVVVHSRWGQDQMATDSTGLPVRMVGLAASDPDPRDRAEARKRLGIEPDTVLLMHLGFLTPEKGMRAVLTAVGAARRAGVPVHLTIVGEGRESSRLDRAVSSLGFDNLVSFTGWVGGDEFRRLPAAADLGVVLRTPSAGETSAAAIRFLACGTPVGVTGLHQFLEWPEGAAPRITPGPAAAADLSRLLFEAAAGGDHWGRRRRAARHAYEENHLPHKVAPEFVSALRELAG
jgi:glycosyltransferase involved in cell wall biosynthesis